MERIDPAHSPARSADGDPVVVDGAIAREAVFAVLVVPIGVLGVVLVGAAAAGTTDDRGWAAVIGAVLAGLGGLYTWWFLTRAERSIAVHPDRVVTRHIVGRTTRPSAGFVSASVVVGSQRVPRSSLEVPRWWIRLVDRKGTPVDIDPQTRWSAGRTDTTDEPARENARALRQSFASHAPPTAGAMIVQTTDRHEAVVWGLRDDAGAPWNLLITDAPIDGHHVHALPAATWLTGNSPGRIIAIVGARTLLAIDLADRTVRHLVSDPDIDPERTTSATLHAVDRAVEPMDRVVSTMAEGWPPDAPGAPPTDALERSVRTAIADDDRRLWRLISTRALAVAVDRLAGDSTGGARHASLLADLTEAGRALAEPGFDHEQPETTATTATTATESSSRPPITLGERVRLVLEDRTVDATVVEVAPWLWILTTTDDDERYLEIEISHGFASSSRLAQLDPAFDVDDIEAVTDLARRIAKRSGDLSRVPDVGATRLLPRECRLERTEG